MKFITKITKFFLVLGFLGVFVGISATIGIYYYLKPNLPSIDSLKDVQLQVPLRIYSKDGLLISEYGEKRRIPLNFEQIPQQMIQAFLAAEDDRFYEHPGVDYQGLIRAAVQLALTGEKKQGGSTITMQVARNFFLTSKKTYLRKISEIFLALKINQDLSKNEVLTLYLNKIYMGNRAYGVGAAAQVYYGKTVEELTLPQIAMIAGLPKAPSRYNPLANAERAVIRRNYVLDRMLSLGFITPDEAKTARETEVTAKRYAANIELNAPYIAEMARSEIYERFGEDSYINGYSVYTTIDSSLQRQAIDAIHMVCNDYDKRHGFRGVISQVPEEKLSDFQSLDAIIEETPVYANLKVAVVNQVQDKSAAIYLGNNESSEIPWEGIQWARAYINEDRRGKPIKKASDVLSKGDLIYVLSEKPTTKEKDEQTASAYWRLAQVPAVNGALVSLDPSNGAINSLVGGYDYFQTKFNRVTQAERQPGSGFKAFIYSSALENGYTAASTINDAPVVFQDSSLESAWRPENYSGKFFGPTRLRYALTKSRNLVSIRLLRSMGVQKALDHIENFGFNRDELPQNLSLALGSANVTPMQMARGYSVLANGGFLIEPYLIDKITQNNDEVIYQAKPKTVCLECEDLAGITLNAPQMQENAEAASETNSKNEPNPVAPRVISKENRYIMYSMMQDVIERGTARRARVLGRKDLAGKTGTTNDQRDAWFNGYNQSIVAVSWVGFDNNSKLGRGEVGGKAALPAWIHYMKKALQNYPKDTPPTMPEGMVTMRIDPKTGLLASPSQKDAIFEVFRADHAPGQQSAQSPVMPITDETDIPANQSPPPTRAVEVDLF
ncbi:MAG: penicillin-binding protein 1A [Gammaproteobacteria bacterium]